MPTQIAGQLLEPYGRCLVDSICSAGRERFFSTRVDALRLPDDLFCRPSVLVVGTRLVIRFHVQLEPLGGSVTGDHGWHALVKPADLESRRQAIFLLSWIVYNKRRPRASFVGRQS